MGNEHGEWIMYGVQEDDPYCIKTIEELTSYINEVGFLLRCRRNGFLTIFAKFI